MSIHNARIWEFVKDFLTINLGMAIYALGWAAFLLPYHITTGGMVGMFAILYYVTGFPISMAVLIANVLLLAVAYKPLGWQFVLKSAYAVLALSTFLSLGQQMMTGDDGQLIQLMGEGQDSMACVLGAILNGVGVGTVLLSGGSTGGWDIVATLVNKYRVEEAMSLLTDQRYDEHSVEEIGDMVGFAQRQSFHSYFQKYVGMTPRAYRMQYRQQLSSKQKKDDEQSD